MSEPRPRLRTGPPGAGGGRRPRARAGLRLRESRSAKAGRGGTTPSSSAGERSTWTCRNAKAAQKAVSRPRTLHFGTTSRLPPHSRGQSRLRAPLAMLESPGHFRPGPGPAPRRRSAPRRPAVGAAPARLGESGAGRGEANPAGGRGGAGLGCTSVASAGEYRAGVARGALSGR